MSRGQDALASIARDFAAQLVGKLAEDCAQFNKRVCASFELIAKRAMQDPEDSKELIDQVTAQNFRNIKKN